VLSVDDMAKWVGERDSVTWKCYQHRAAAVKWWKMLLINLIKDHIIKKYQENNKSYDTLWVCVYVLIK
jgi:hypothetical protein